MDHTCIENKILTPCSSIKMEPTFSPAMMHRDSVSTALDSLKHLSRVLPISVATLDGLTYNNTKVDFMGCGS